MSACKPCESFGPVDPLIFPEPFHAGCEKGWRCRSFSSWWYVISKYTVVCIKWCREKVKCAHVTEKQCCTSRTAPYIDPRGSADDHLKGMYLFRTHTAPLRCFAVTLTVRRLSLRYPDLLRAITYVLINLQLSRCHPVIINLFVYLFIYLFCLPPPGN